MSFTCPDCGRTSQHPMDAEEQYCGHCHKFYVQVLVTITDLKTGKLLYLANVTRSEDQVRDAIIGMGDAMYPKNTPLK